MMTGFGVILSWKEGFLVHGGVSRPTSTSPKSALTHVVVTSDSKNASHVDDLEKGCEPVSLSHHGGCLIKNGEVLVLVGGWTGKRRSNTIHVFNLKQKQWIRPNTRMTTTNIKLENHKSLLAKEISLFQWSQTFADLKIICQDGSLLSHRAILGGVSPFLRKMFVEHKPGGDDLFALIFPDQCKSDFLNLLSLLYAGRANLYKSEIPTFIELTQTLKMKSIPVSVNEHKWVTRFPVEQILVEVVEQNLHSPTKRRTLKRRQKEPAERDVCSRSTPILSTKQTRSGRIVVPKKFDDQIVGDFSFEIVDEKVFESEQSQKIPSNEHKTIQDKAVGPTSKRSRGRPRKNRGQEASVTSSVAPDATVAGAEMEGLDNLLSVAEAFELSQQPDFNDITNPVADSSDTHKMLLRICVLCNKQVLGRNAYGRHMKNAHPKVFGPYTCPVDDCARSCESGVKIMQHMHSHLGPRAQALAQGQRFTCEDCQAIYTTASRLNDHRRKRHGAEIGTAESRFSCNAHGTGSDLPAACKIEFSTAKHFSDHMSQVHNLKAWLCQICPKRFQERQNYQYHMMSHAGAKSFFCDICQKSFANPRQLYCHRALHLGRRFLCSHCGFRARSSANLRGHVKSKHESRQFECKFCCKKFSSGNNLKNHVRIHTGETPYDCELCGVKFKRMHHLHSHIESKLHSEVMEKARLKGCEVPDHLDPVKRARGREIVEDGPITCLTLEQLEQARKEEERQEQERLAARENNVQERDLNPEMSEVLT